MNATDVIYSQAGIAVYRVLDGGRIVDFSGRSRGWLTGKYVYSYQGAQRGCYEAGLLRVDDGSIAGFGEGPTGPHPVLPVRSARPAPAPVEPEPARPSPASPAVTAAVSATWSATPLEQVL